jgi:hypothetical protein
VNFAEVIMKSIEAECVNVVFNFLGEAKGSGFMADRLLKALRPEGGHVLQSQIVVIQARTLATIL